MKYLPSMMIAGTLLLTVVTPALAWGWHSPELEIKNSALIANVSLSGANSGLISVGGGREVEIRTGDATALSDATVNGVNAARIGRTRGDVEVSNRAKVLNISAAVASTGLIKVGGGKEVEIRTGDAWSESYGTVKNVNSTF